MKRYRLPYAEWSWAEYRGALWAFFLGRNKARGQAVALEAELANLMGATSVYALNSGRAALQIALRVFSELRPDRSHVIVPSYVCPAVVESVLACGLVPLPVPVGTDLNLVLDEALNALDETVLAIVVPHMYGCPAAIAAFERLAQSGGVFLIDDAAQVVGEHQSGRMLGTFGDIGLISFAQSKCIVAGESGAGGVLICNNSKLKESVEAHIGQLQPANGRRRALLSFIWNYQLGNFPQHLSYYWIRLCGSERKKLVPALISNLDAVVARCQLRLLGERRQERLRVLGLYAQILEAEFSAMPISLPQYAPDRFLSRVVVVLPKQIDSVRLKRSMEAFAWGLRFGYPTYDVDISGRIRQARRNEVLELPLYSGMTYESVLDICLRLIKYMNENRFGEN